jgi:hypothetical protein
MAMNNYLVFLLKKGIIEQHTEFLRESKKNWGTTQSLPVCMREIMIEILHLARLSKRGQIGGERERERENWGTTQTLSAMAGPR